MRGQVAPDGRWLRVAPGPGRPEPDPRRSDAAPLFGSAIGMREAFENALDWLSVEMEGVWHRRHPALPLPEAVRAASALAAATPARLIGEADRGVLAPGSRADAVLVRIEGGPGDHRVEVRAAWSAGKPP